MSHRPSKNVRVVDCLADIQDAIGWIARHSGGMTEQDFLKDRKTQDSVIKNLVDFGEASNNIMRIDPVLAQTDPDLWQHLSGAYDMRIKSTHGYRSVDASVVWNTMTVYLPEFARLVDTTLAEYRAANGNSQ